MKIAFLTRHDAAQWAFLTLIGAVMCLSGCTTYDITKPDGTRVAIRSTRSFPNGITVDYQSPQGASLKIQAGSVATPDPLSAIGANVVKTLLERTLPPPVAAPATVATPAPAGGK